MPTRFRNFFLAVATATIAGLGCARSATAPLKALIVDGRNNHNWETTTDALRAILEGNGRFTVTGRFHRTGSRSWHHPG